MAQLGVDRIESNISQTTTLSSDTSFINPEDVTTFSSASRGLDDTYDSEDDSEIEIDDDFFDDDSSTNSAAQRIPFSTVHKCDLPFTSGKRKCFQPGQRVSVKVTDIQVPDNSRLLNPNVYVVELKHGDFAWTIKRRYKHFRQLHEQLLLFKARINLPYPTRAHQQRKRTYANHKQRLPHFPKTPDPLVEDLERRKEQLQNYLQGVLRNPLFRNHTETLQFLEVSHLSFVNQTGGKWREGFVRKRSGGHKFSLGPLKKIRGCVGNCRLCEVWKIRWLIVKDTCVLYVNPDTGTIRDVILMDNHFKVKHGKEGTGIRHGLVITNLNRKLTLRSWTSRKAKEWWRSIDSAAQEHARDFTQHNRFGSFAPAREDTPVKWFQDAATYMAGVADALETAKEEIFITDWWLSPEVFMKRPIKDEGGKWRLDMILKRRAEAGVKIFIMLYKEMQVALGINSFYSKQVLQDLHPNIKVLRHPDGIALWSHHEKCVVIDQRIAFLGGIDLCYGRWDTPAHRLIDIGSRGEYIEAEDVHLVANATKIRASPNANGSAGGDAAVLQVHADHNSFESPSTFKPKNHRSSKPTVTFGEPTSSEDALDELDLPRNGHYPRGDNMTYALPGKNSVLDSPAISVQLHQQSSKDSTGTRRSSSASMFMRDDRSLSSSCGSDTDASSTDLDQEEYEQDHDSKENDRILAGTIMGEASPKKEKKPIKIKPKSPSRPQYVRSSSMPADVHFHKFQSRSTEFDMVDGASKPKSASTKSHKKDDAQSKREALKQRRAISLQRQLATIDSESDSDVPYNAGDNAVSDVNTSNNNNEGSDDSGSSQPNDKKAHATATPEDVTVDVIPGKESSSQKSGKTFRSIMLGLSSPKGDQLSQQEGSAGDPTDVNDKGKTRRKLPDIPKHAKVIQFASPYEDSVVTDAHEQIENDQDRKAGQVNKAFRDSEPSDAKDRIIYDPSTRSYENQSARVKEDVVPTSRKPSLDRNSNLSESTEDGGEPSTFKNYIRLLIAAQRLAKTTEKSEDPGDTSIKEEEFIASQKRDQKKATGFRAKLNRMKSMKEERDSDSEDEKPKKPPKSKSNKLQRQTTVDHVDSATVHPTPVVLNPKKLAPHEKKPLQQYIPTDKPSTPPSKRKEMQRRKKDAKIQKQLEKMDRKQTTKDQSRTDKLKAAFRGNRSKSMGVHHDVTMDGIDFSEYQQNQKETPDDVINKLTEDETFRLWIGKDYTNFIFKDFVDLDRPFDDFIDRKNTPRMPWHDIGAAVFGKGARDVARHFIQRWNFTKISKRKDNTQYPMLLPKAYRHVPIPPIVINDPNVMWANSQILRSSSHWSAGIKYTETSIMQAYVDMITRANHFIYIENQFFVTIMGHDVVENKIAEALYSRILHAYRNNEKFLVLVILPLLPAFEGELGTSRGSAIQAVTHWNYSSICRGGKSLLERLMEAGVQDPFKYISFYGLRTHGELDNNLISELVYVHCKLMIVDDCRTIIGSANINDRSLIGKRDSELAILVEDTELQDGMFSGQRVKVGKFGHSLRMSLFREHLGIDAKDAVQADITDPLIKTFLNGVWMRQASVNTKVFDQVFKCLPCDEVHSFQQLKEYSRHAGLAVTDPDRAREMLKRVRGHLVVLPLQFLCKEGNLARAFASKESLAPNVIWT